MPNVDITCVQCKEVFHFSQQEQEQYYQRNMMTPQRCPKCCSKKAAKGANAPTRFEIVCDNCRKHDRVPFQPKSGRAILCKDCFQASRTRSKAAFNK